MKKSLWTIVAATIIFSISGIASAATTGYQSVREVMVDFDDSTPKCYIKLETSSGQKTWYSMASNDMEKISWCESLALTALSTGRKLNILYNGSASNVTRIYIHRDQ